MRRKRCPDCDWDGDVHSPTGGYIRCPRCNGSKKIEADPMNEETMYRWLMITTAVLTALCGLAAVGLMVASALQFTWAGLLCSLLLTGGAVGSGYGTVYFSTKTTVPKVFNNQDEREVLTNKQRRELKKARGEVVMERAMIEVEHERENIVHNLQLEASDPEVPPHRTRWSQGGSLHQLQGKQERNERNYP